MNTAAPNRRSGIFSRLSGGMLLVMALLVATAMAIWLSWIVLGKARQAEDARLRSVEAYVLSALEEGGLSGLSQKLDALDAGFLGKTDPVLIAVWRLRGGQRVVHRAVPAGAAEILAQMRQGGAEQITSAGRDYRVLAPDIPTLSKDWAAPMSDVALAIASPYPGLEGQAARQTVLAVWSGLALAMIVGGLLHLNHVRRYRHGLWAINARLERAASGETGLRMPDDVPAPELRDLTQRLNKVLPRFDDLVLGLRDLSATMAHEMKTPLQVIRSDLSRLCRADGDAARSQIAADIDRTIDIANARLHSIMQLFRLEAQVEIPMQAEIDLSGLVENAVDDLVDLLETRDRVVQADVAGGIRVAGNRQLLDLMIGNLLINSAKYAPKGAHICIGLTRQGHGFRLSVSNTGQGFPEDVRKSAFERYSRAGSTGDIPGTGIGLSLVKAIVTRHGFSAAITPSDSIAEVVIAGPVVVECDAKDSQREAEA